MSLSQNVFNNKAKWVKSAAVDSDGELWYYGCTKSELDNRGLSYETWDPSELAKFSGKVLPSENWMTSATDRRFK